MKFLYVLLVVMVLFLLVGPVLAAEPPVDLSGVALVSGSTPVDQAADVIFRAIYTAVFIPMAAPLINILTSGLKTIPFMRRFTSPVIVFGLNCIVWVLFQVMNQAGYGGYFDSVIDVTTTIATMLLAIFGTQAVAGRMYDVARANNIPVMGYKRPEVVVG